MKPFIVCVTGGRTFSDHFAIDIVMSFVRDNLPQGVQMYVLEGGALGADRACREWAIRNKVPVLTCEAQWENHKRSAGMIRNSWMSDLGVNLLMVFPGGNGTQHMFTTCRDKGIPCVHTTYFKDIRSGLGDWLRNRGVA